MTITDEIEYIVFTNRWDNIRPHAVAIDPDAVLEEKDGNKYVHGKVMLVYVNTQCSTRAQYAAIVAFFNSHLELFEIIPGTRDIKKMQDKRFLVTGDNGYLGVDVLKKVVDKYFQDVCMGNRCCVKMKEIAVVANVFNNDSDRAKLAELTDYVYKEETFASCVVQ